MVINQSAMGQIRRSSECRRRRLSTPLLKSRHYMPSEHVAVSRMSCKRNPSSDKKQAVERHEKPPLANMHPNGGDRLLFYVGNCAPGSEAMARNANMCDFEVGSSDSTVRSSVGMAARSHVNNRCHPKGRMQRPRSAEPHCHGRISTGLSLPLPATHGRLRQKEHVEVTTHVEPIAGAQWLQALERRIERASNLAPGSLQTAVLLSRASDAPGIDSASDAPPRPSRPSSAVRSETHPSRPSSAARIGLRPSSAVRSLRPRSAALSDRSQAEKTEATQPLLVVGAAHGSCTFLSAYQRMQCEARKEQTQVDEEWKQLGVIDCDSDSDSEEGGSVESHPGVLDDMSWEKKLALSLGQKRSSQHVVSPVSSPVSSLWSTLASVK